LDLGRKFDLALSLEVAEHLEPQFANVIVDTLTRHADAIIFGAALPMQGGTHHVNEQWPNYWIRKFEERGFECYDLIRPLFWNEARIAAFYIQNTFLFLRINSSQPKLAIERIIRERYAEPQTMVFIHPRQYIGIASMEKISVRLMVRQAPKVLARRVLGRLGIRF
jgi:hypothetical protein